MKLIVDTVGPTDPYEVDIDAIIDSCESADILFAFVLSRICTYVARNDQSLDDYYIVQLDGGEEEGLDVPDDSACDFTHLREACQLFWYLYVESSGIDEARIFARLSEHWKYTDFDNLKSEVEDDFCGEYDDGDAADWVREYMSDTGTELPEHLQSYFDYDAYAEALLDDYDKYEWNYKVYLYSR